jgi:hypothetical protein
MASAQESGLRENCTSRLSERAEAGRKLHLSRLYSRASGEGPNDGEGDTPAGLGDAMPQKSDDGLSAQTAGAVKPQGPRLRAEAPPAGSGNERLGSGGLMERVCERPNLLAALRRVRQNAGSPGIDGMTVEALSDHLRVHWPRLREELLAGRYQPQPVRRVAIPKPGGGERELGIPTVLDRFIQQALLQVLQPLFDPTFSDASYGFRPGRRAHDAVRRAQAYVQEGRSVVVDITWRSSWILSHTAPWFMKFRRTAHFAGLSL